MRILICHICRCAYQVGGDVEEIKRLLDLPEWQASIPCITPLCQGRMVKVPNTPMGYLPTEIPVHNFYRAALGFGTGSGAPASLEKVREALTSQRVVEVQADAAGQPERTIIRQLVLEDGTRLHFDASSKGACVYYIESRSHSCVEVFDNEQPFLRSGADLESSDSDREEARRNLEGGGPNGVAEQCDEASDSAHELQRGSVPDVQEACALSTGTHSGTHHDGRVQNGDSSSS